MRRQYIAATAAGAAVLYACGGDPAVNGCERASAVDARGRPELTVRVGEGDVYSFEPDCARVSAGSRLRFVGDFRVHPIAPGRALENGVVELREGGPIERVREGREAVFTLDEPGAYGFYCDVHLVSGMLGAVFVE